MFELSTYILHFIAIPLWGIYTTAVLVETIWYVYHFLNDKEYDGSILRRLIEKYYDPSLSHYDSLPLIIYVLLFFGLLFFSLPIMNIFIIGFGLLISFLLLLRHIIRLSKKKKSKDK